MSSVHYVFLCGVQRSIERSVHGLQVVHVVFRLQVDCAMVAMVTNYRLKVDSYKSKSKKLPRVYVDSRVSQP